MAITVQNIDDLIAGIKAEPEADKRALLVKALCAGADTLPGCDDRASREATEAKAAADKAAAKHTADEAAKHARKETPKKETK